MDSSTPTDQPPAAPTAGRGGRRAGLTAEERKARAEANPHIKNPEYVASGRQGGLASQKNARDANALDGRTMDRDRGTYEYDYAALADARAARLEGAMDPTLPRPRFPLRQRPAGAVGFAEARPELGATWNQAMGQNFKIGDPLPWWFEWPVDLGDPLSKKFLEEFLGICQKHGPQPRPTLFDHAGSSEIRSTDAGIRPFQHQWGLSPNRWRSLMGKWHGRSVARDILEFTRRCRRAAFNAQKNRECPDGYVAGVPSRARARD